MTDQKEHDRLDGGVSQSDESTDGTEQCERCNDGEILGRVYVSADYDEAMTTKYRLCQDCIRSVGEWYRGTEGGRNV